MKKAFITVITIFFTLTGFQIIKTGVFKTYAAEKFSLEHNIIYDIQPTGTTTVSQDITITNQDNDVIATNYALITKYKDMFEEKATEDENNLAIKKEIEADTTKLTAIFNNVSIGEGNVKKFNISYKTNDIIYKIGDVWYVNIPKSELTNATTLYNVQLIIPKEFGNKLFISPQPQLSKETSNETITYYFTKENLINTGITAAFGTYQTLNFKLDYQLKNDTYLKSIYEITLPSDIEGYQQLSFKEIDPTPKKIYLDKDKNVIAQYKLDGHSNLDITVKGTVKIITKQIDPAHGGGFEDIPKDIVSRYTKEDTYWETSSKLVENLKNKLYEKDKNVSQNAYNVYAFLVDNFEYNTEVINQPYTERKGAVTALTNQDPIACMEFTDIFITLARSMGIPAREIDGYAITNDNHLNTPTSINVKGGDLLHAWAEFYDPSFGWIQIDPTWGNTSRVDYFTKLDTNHFAFVTRGVDSEYPLPAGMYRYENNTKLINIDFSDTQQDSLFEPKLNIKKVFNFSPIHWILGYSRYEVENTGNVFVYDINNRYLAPNQKIKLFVHKKTKEIKYKDFNGNGKTLSIND